MSNNFRNNLSTNVFFRLPPGLIYGNFLNVSQCVIITFITKIRDYHRRMLRIFIIISS